MKLDPDERGNGEVSIQLMSPASGDTEKLGTGCNVHKVSIQLMSPASGDDNKAKENLKSYISFHSINVPSEWGRKIYNTEVNVYTFPFN